MADGFNTINGGIDNEIRPAIEDLKENKVSYTEAEKMCIRDSLVINHS